MPVLGIPRALYYFHFHPLWESFLTGLGFEVVVSPPTNKEILEWGLSSCVDGMCLPVKACVGHVLALSRAGVDLIFLPQIISVGRAEYTCPNFLGLPDLIRQYLPGKTEILSPVLDGRKGPRALQACYLRFGRQHAAGKHVRRSWRTALKSQSSFEQRLRCCAETKGKSLLLLGPRYLTDDPFLSGNLVGRLEQLGANVLTAANADLEGPGNAALPMNKPFFWTETRQSWRAAQEFLTEVDGLVTAAPFGCGAQSLLSIFVQEWAAGHNVPKLELHLDEHTCELGTLTRLEAFCDLLERTENRYENHLSPLR